ncbi:MAG: hypothetical protein JW834_00470 [Candidatus Diapherotrites archaeon]|nr:hypothetical protein [Candidatus Diapherotrites archaeon]
MLKGKRRPQKELRVGVVGIPVVEHAEIPYREVFSEGNTHRLRGLIRKHLEAFSGELLEKGIVLVVSDCGEIIRDNKLLSSNLGTHAVFKDVAEEMKRLDSKHDLLLVVGGKHTPAYCLYQFPGNVARVDFHADSQAYEKLEFSNYLRYVLLNGLKKPHQVRNFGLRENLSLYSMFAGGPARISKDINLAAEPTFKRHQTDVHKVRARTFDIDSDGLHEKYDVSYDAYVSSRFGVSASNLGKALIRNGPSRVGFFEYYPQNENAHKLERMIVALSKAAVIGVASRVLRQSTN